MNLYFSLKIIKEKQRKVNFQKEQQVLHQQALEIKWLKQILLLKQNNDPSQTVKLHPLLRASRDRSTVCFTRPSGT